MLQMGQSSTCPCRHFSGRPSQALPRSARTFVVRAEENGSVAVADSKTERKPSPLSRGGTLSGTEALGKDASPAVKATVAGDTGAQTTLRVIDGRFIDYRWVGGRWVLPEFASAGGVMDYSAWEKVIDAEMERRRLLEESPIPSTNEEPVLFDTAEIPWWAWVRRFHLPEAEKLNGRAAMIGYVLALGVDKLTGAGLADQQGSFLGLVALHLTVFGILLFRTSDSIPAFKNLIEEATFYDKQWAATWDGQTRPSETEK